MSRGSGGGGSGSFDTSAADARARESEERKAATDASNLATERTRQDTDKAEREQRFNTSLESSVGNARTRAKTALTNRGLDFTLYSDPIEQALDNTRLSVPQSSENVGSFFGDDFVNGILNNVQSTKRLANTRSLASVFATPNFANDRFKTTSTGSFIDDVLGTQRTEALTSLDRARARGNLNETGFAAGQARIGELQKSGRSTANSLSDAAVQKYRAKANDIHSRAKADASSFELGNSAFDVGSYGAELNTLGDTFNSNIEGDTRAALSGQNFFDIGDILTRAGTSQGAVNVAMPSAGVVANRRGIIPGLLDRDQAGGGVF